MDRNLIIAIVVSIVIIVTFQYYFQSFSPPPKKKSPVATKERRSVQPPPSPRVTEPRGEPEVTREEPQPATSAVVTRPAPAAPAAPLKETRIKIESPLYEAIISSKGARIISFELKKYKKSLKGDALVNLFSENPNSSGPSIMLTRRSETLNDATLDYHSDAGESTVTLDQQGAKKSITYTATTPAGLTIKKAFTFHADTYSVDFNVTLTNKSDEDRDYLVTFPWRKVYYGEKGNSRFQWNSAEILLNGELKDYYFKSIKGDEEPSGRVLWAGLGSVYFFKALVFGERPAKKVTLFKPTKAGIAEIWVRYGAVDLAAGKAVPLHLSLYLGPKEHQALTAAGHQLSRALFYSNYFILQIMSEYLMKFLRFCHSGLTIYGHRIPGTGNWGVDIIILTIVIKILFIPLTHKSMKSMKRMQEIQPQIAKMKEKYKDDKAALNKATMDLFREHKVNPLGSCWPMFLQLPVFIALYQTLSYAIELRHAYFLCIPSIFLCIKDLSAPDPYYVTPILMGGSMVLQQWMTPTGGDPTQRKMMLLMPVIFTYLFLSFPAGLVLYWLVSNVLSIGQQVLTNRMAK